MNPRILFLVPPRTERQEEMKRLLTSIHIDGAPINYATFEMVDSEIMAWLMQNGFTIKAFLHTTTIAVLW